MVNESVTVGGTASITMALFVPSEPVAVRPGNVSVAALPAASVIALDHGLERELVSEQAVTRRVFARPCWRDTCSLVR